MITLRTFRSGAGILVLIGFLLTCFAAWRGARLRRPFSPYEMQMAAYNRLTSLPLPAAFDLAYGPGSLAFRRQCHPFLFPRPTSTVFVTAWPNHGAGLGHQFGEWLYGPSIAVMMNLSYVHTGMSGNAARWDEWLGFGAGEDSEADVRNVADIAHVVVRLDTAHSHH
jgi:hypothetical protein